MFGVPGCKKYYLPPTARQMRTSERMNPEMRHTYFQNIITGFLWEKIHQQTMADYQSQ